jgi:fused signal recognition particle receptor
MFKFFKKVKAFFKPLGAKIRALFGQPLDEETFQKLEQLLYESDLGSKTAQDFTEDVRAFVRKNPEASTDEIVEAMRQHALKILQAPPKVQSAQGHPHVVLVVGVNGSGKTTSIAKLAKMYQQEGKSVLLATGDTFRAAAIDQLGVWAERLGTDIVKAKPGSDPSAVAFDALTAAKARSTDVVLTDTAGRLQNKTDLMQELEKVKRVCKKVIPDSPHEVILVLDATIGQNALDQAKVFHQFTPLSGIFLAKLDGSAKGGIILAIYEELGVPVRWIGTGEKAEDFALFDSEEYVRDLF